MVREHVVLAAGVDVDPIAQVLARHGRALDVPAGKAVGTVVAVPLHQVLGIALPQGEVRGRALLVEHLHPRTREEVLDAVAREATVGLSEGAGSAGDRTFAGSP